MAYAEPPDIYEGDALTRFALGKKGTNPLIVFGINPSEADDKIPDSTIKRVIGFAKSLGNDGWLMLNIYPQRNVNPDMLHLEMNEDWHWNNMLTITRHIQALENPTLIAAWGTNIIRRPYLKQCLSSVMDGVSELPWKTIGPLTNEGHPKHPLYLNGDLQLEEFNMPTYLSKL